MKRPLWLAIAAGLVVFVLAWWMVQKGRGPALAGDQVESRPLVQTVVATGRVVAVSSADVGSPVTGVVVERRVEEGDTAVCCRGVRPVPKALPPVRVRGVAGDA